MCYKRPVKLYARRTWIRFGASENRAVNSCWVIRLFKRTETAHGSWTYTITPGLLELLLKKQPQMSQITPQDWDDYQAMVTSTNTNRKRYLKTGPIRLSTLETNQTFYEKG